MLAKKNEYLQDAVSGIAVLTEDEMIREQCQAREDYEYWERIKENRHRRELMEQKNHYQEEIAERDNKIKEKDDKIKEKDNKIKERDDKIKEKDQKIEEQTQAISQLNQIVTELGARLAKLESSEK